MKEQIEILVKLQSIETESSSLQLGLGQVSEKLLHLDQELVLFEKNIADQEAAVSVLQKKYRDLESEVKMNLERRKKTQTKLRMIKDNKEYQALLKEIEDNRDRNSQLEDLMLDCLDQLDQSEKKLETLKREHVELSRNIRQEKEQIEQETRLGQQKLAELDLSHARVACQVAPELMVKFNQVKAGLVGGLAVVPVIKAVCYGCHINIPPQIYNELHRGDSLKFCPNCHRIIYWEKSV